MSPYIASIDYATELPAGSHWSFRLAGGSILRLTALGPGANVGMLLHNPHDLAERYNAPDTLKAQHTFRLTAGHCLYSDMGRVMASVVEDDFGWHDSVCGTSRAAQVDARYGPRSYQADRNDWHQNGFDAFLVELAKYGLSRRDLAANLNWFSRVVADERGDVALAPPEGIDETPVVTLRVELDTLVVLHTCPHPLATGTDYPRAPVRVELGTAHRPRPDDPCMNLCDENRRGFENNRLYGLGRPRAGIVAGTAA